MGDIFWFRAIIPGELLGGSTRQVNISDGSTSLEFDIKIPAFDVPAAKGTPEKPTASVKAPAATSENTSEETLASEKSGLPTSILESDIFIYACIGVGIIILIIVIVVVRKKKRKAVGNANSEQQKTITNSDSIQGATELLNNFDVNSNEGYICISLRNLNVENQVWNIVLIKDVIVGRDKDCQICLEDTSVSHKQCRLYFDRVVKVENLSNSNKTQLNGSQVDAPAIVNTGDKIKCGRVTLLVDSLYSEPGTGDLKKGTGFIRV